MAWRGSQNSVRLSLTHHAGFSSNYASRTESHDHMGPVGEDPRWEVFGPFHDYLREAFPLVYVFLRVRIKSLIRL